MSDYRRLISYIYEYEGKEKGKNAGYVKLEVRNGQCRLSLSVKNVYMGSNAIGVFLLSKTETEVFLGNIFIRSGAGEFRALVDAKNVEGNRGGLDTYYGLTIHDVKNPWRSYTTIWEDAVDPETLPGSLPGAQGNGDTVKMLPAQEILPGSLGQSEEEPVMAVASVVREIEAEIAREEERRKREETVLSQASEPETMPVGPAVPPVPEELPKEPSEPPVPEELPVGQPAPREIPPEPEKNPSISRSPELENPEVLRYLQETEDVTAEPEKLWQELRKSYPKIQPFDYESGCEILTIRPQDIGRLPRESWVYGNNSFLLHGYYNFRYIILFRLGNKDGRARYLIGVPGHYYSSEKYMASMFGFPNFVLSKKQPLNDGRFGYWYTDIRVR